MHEVEYALAHSRLLYEPDRRIDTFGDTRFNFIMLSEPMDAVNQTIIREGWIEARRPRIITPNNLKEIKLDGFGKQAKVFFEWMAARPQLLAALLDYGFVFQRSQLQQQLLHEPLAQVREKMLEMCRQRGAADLALIEGIEEGWEMALLHFCLEMMQKSSSINIFDFKRRGLL